MASRVAPAPVAPAEYVEHEVAVSPQRERRRRRRKKKKRRKSVATVRVADAVPSKPSAIEKFGRRVMAKMNPPPPVLNRDARRICEYLNLSKKDIRYFQCAFIDIDIDLSGEVDLHEMMQYFDQPHSPYTEAVVALSADKTDEMTFSQFFCVCARYGMYSEEEVLHFAFSCFDKNDNGIIDYEEFIDLTRIMSNADPLFARNVKKALQQMDLHDDKLFTFEDFKIIHREHPFITWPAYHFQHIIHEKIGGEAFWVALMERVQLMRQLSELRKQNPDATAMDLVPLWKRALCWLCLRKKFQSISELKADELAVSFWRRKVRKKGDAAHKKRRRRTKRSKKRRKRDQSGKKHDTKQERLRSAMDEQRIMKSRTPEDW